MGIDTDFISVREGMSRINVKVKAAEETEINGIGPAITEADVEALYAKIDQLTADDILIVSGSVPATMPVTSTSASWRAWTVAACASLSTPRATCS